MGRRRVDHVRREVDRVVAVGDSARGGRVADATVPGGDAVVAASAPLAPVMVAQMRSRLERPTSLEREGHDG